MKTKAIVALYIAGQLAIAAGAWIFALSLLDMLEGWPEHLQGRFLIAAALAYVGESISDYATFRAHGKSNGK